MKDKINLNQNSENVNSVIPPEDWKNGLTSEEFFIEVKKMLKRKFEERDRK